MDQPETVYDRAFAIADKLWAAGYRLQASWIAVATDGISSGEILPKLESTLRGMENYPRVRELGLSDECRLVADEIARILAPYR